MFNLFKKSFWVPYEDVFTYPSLPKTMEAISKYCDGSGESCIFTGDDEVEIDGRKYTIYRGLSSGSRGGYGIKCREK